MVPSESHGNGNCWPKLMGIEIGMGIETEWELAVGVLIGMGMTWEETWELNGKW